MGDGQSHAVVHLAHPAGRSAPGCQDPGVRVMAITPRVLCLLLALVCFAVATFYAPPPRFSLLGAGLALFVLSFLVG